VSRLKGVAGARRRARARADLIDDNAIEAIGETVDAVHRAGLANIDNMIKRRSGRLRRRYRKTIRKTKGQGLVGYISAAARRDAFYARFVHDGTRYILARPFHDLAVLEQDGPHSRRMRRALRKTISLAGSPSSLGRTGRGRMRGV